MTNTITIRRAVVPLLALTALAIALMAAANPQTYPAPTNVTASNTADGHVRVSWNDDAAPVHRVGWANAADLHAAIAAGDWAEAFHFADTRRQTDYVVKYLPTGQQYYFAVGAASQRFGPVVWGPAVQLTTAAADGAGSEEGASGDMLAPEQTFDAVRQGARLILSYDPVSNSFVGAVSNTTSRVLQQVRVEVHLSNGAELGPTAPRDLAPGEVATINLPSTAASFTGWTAHAEVGGGGEGSESGGGEHGGGSEGSHQGREGGNESATETAMSSPIIPLDRTWNGVLGGLAVSASYDTATQTVHSTVQNTLSQTLCYVQAEPHLKSGTRTVGELGPDQLGDLNPGRQAVSSIPVSSEPNLAGVSFDGYVVHMEVFDCGGPGPAPHAGGQGGESSGEHGSGGERRVGG